MPFLLYSVAAYSSPLSSALSMRCPCRLPGASDRPAPGRESRAAGSPRATRSQGAPSQRSQEEKRATRRTAHGFVGGLRGRPRAGEQTGPRAVTKKRFFRTLSFWCRGSVSTNRFVGQLSPRSATARFPRLLDWYSEVLCGAETRTGIQLHIELQASNCILNSFFDILGHSCSGQFDLFLSGW